MAKSVSVFRKWLMSIDQPLLIVVLLLISIGILVSITSTPAVAIKLGLSPFYFTKQHIITLPIALIIIFFLSRLQTNHIILLSIIGGCGCVFLILCTLIFGSEIKGAKRWIDIFGFSLQPSEFLKPTLSIITAWFISKQYKNKKFNGITYSILSMVIVVPLLLKQPDIGMTVIIVSTWVAQLFVSGLSILLLASAFVIGIASLVGVYFALPHFADRINKFIFPTAEDNDLYQIERSLQAFKNGELFGTGPGEGTVKMTIPDCHSDFVFSVIGEEFGLFMCIGVMLLFAILVIRPILKIISTSSMFCLSAIFGLSVQIFIQTSINICSALHLIPTKGMTLQFISYGCSSFLSSAICVGFLLALTKYSSLINGDL